jgi:hypothetical protein|tara:strand:+ start:149 stop:256 length:108 start_codon:yes stop_codon:yes gene_type:complete
MERRKLDKDKAIEQNMEISFLKSIIRSVIEVKDES